MNLGMKCLYLVRGVSGAGKSTLADQLFGTTVSADQYFEYDGGYEFDASKLGHAHKWCQKYVENLMQGNNDVAVANTFTTVKEMKPYYKLAEEYGYTVFSIIVENRHGGTDVHNVPEEALQRQENRFNIKLR